MSTLLLIVLIVFGVIGFIWLYKLLKPYFLKYDTTLCITGGLGSGKTLTAVKTAIVLIRRQRLTKYYLYNWFWKQVNKVRHFNNNRKKKHNEKVYDKYKDINLIMEHIKKLKKLHQLRPKPMLYSNIPIHYKTHLLGRKREWAKRLNAAQVVCLQKIVEYSVVLIDELPQFVNQFNWNEELIQKNTNEWITFFRHYYGGYFITTAQSVDDVVVQIRRKLNQAVWCYDFKKWLFGLFYTIRMCDIMLSDQVGTISTTMLEENTKLHFGLFPRKGTYETRCYKPRVNNIYKEEENEEFTNTYTTKVLRLMKYKSPVDDTTTKEEKQKMWEKGEEIWKN